MKNKIYSHIPAIMFGVLVISFLAAFYVFAWTEPSVAPPGDNVPAPLNVSINAQSKEGALVVGTNSAVTTGLIVQYGNVGIGTTSPSSGTGGQLKMDVHGNVGADQYCDKDGNNCKTSSAMWGGWVNDGTAYPNLNIPEVTWYDLDLSPRVGNRRTLVLLKVGSDQGAKGTGFNRGIIAKPYSDSDDPENVWGEQDLNQVHLTSHGYYESIMTTTDNNGHIGLRSTAFGVVQWDIILVGYIN